MAGKLELHSRREVAATRAVLGAALAALDGPYDFRACDGHSDHSRQLRQQSEHRSKKLILNISNEA
jgi:hypothetical protein